MDVTEQIRRYQIQYGASDFNDLGYIAAQRKLNYAQGSNINKPIRDKVSLIPSVLKYQDETGLFGTENTFVRVDVRAINPTAICFVENTYECAELGTEEVDPSDSYTYIGSIKTNGQANIYDDLDLEPLNSYDPAQFAGDTIPNLNDTQISVNLKNLKTGNQYIDSWLDVRLYTANREEHPYDFMWAPLNGTFYVGFHARNTRRLPYNVEITVGEQVVNKEDIEDTRYIMRL